MPEGLVIASFVLTYGAILGYATWLHLRWRDVGEE